MSDQESLSFEALLEALHDTAKPLPAAAIYRLSALPEDEITILAAEWPRLPVERRQVLLSRLTETSEADFKMDFTISPVEIMAELIPHSLLFAIFIPRLSNFVIY